MDLDAYIGSKLQRLRQENGVDQSRLANLMSVTRETIAAYENGSKPMPATSLYDLACHFDVPVTYFVSGYEALDSRSPTSATKTDLIRAGCCTGDGLKHSEALLTSVPKLPPLSLLLRARWPGLRGQPRHVR